MFTLMDDECEQFIHQVEQERRPLKNLQDRKWNMDVDEEYMNELLRYNFQSTKKGRGFSSLLVQRKSSSDAQIRWKVDHVPQA